MEEIAGQGPMLALHASSFDQNRMVALYDKLLEREWTRETSATNKQWHYVRLVESSCLKKLSTEFLTIDNAKGEEGGSKNRPQLR